MPFIYLLYSVVQYVHSRREERLNVGVVIYDQRSRQVRATFRAKAASYRIKSMFPEVDRAGLEHYLRDVERSLNGVELPSVEQGGNPLDVLAAEWQNIIRFTPARPIPATDIAGALRQLASDYVAPPRGAEVRQVVGIRYAKERTRQAIQRILDPPPGDTGYTEFREHYSFWQHGKEYQVPVNFPFQVRSVHVIDAVSFHVQGGFEVVEKEAAAFIQKTDQLRKVAPGVKPYATVAVPPHRREEAETLMAFMCQEAGLPKHAVVNADEAEVVVNAIAHAA